MLVFFPLALSPCALSYPLGRMVMDGSGTSGPQYTLLFNRILSDPGAVEKGTMEGTKQQGRRVLLFPLPFQGHISPMFQLASLLHRRGFSITIFHTNLNYPDTTSHPDFHFVPIPDGLSKMPGDDDHDPLAVIAAINTNCEAPLREHLGQMVKESSGEGVACLIVDSHLYSVRTAAELVGLPTLVLRTGSAACCNVFFAFPLLWEKGYLPIRDTKSEVPVSELPPLRVRDLPLLGPNSSQMSLRQTLTQVVKGIRASSGLILNTFDAIEGAEVDKIQQQASIPVFSLGPLHMFAPHPAASLLPRDNSCIQWLDQQAAKSVLYVSFGSIACMDSSEFIETAWGLSDSHHPFLWVLRPGSVLGLETQQPELPQGFEEETRGRGKVIEWAPQQEVLGHPAVGGFWTHNGWNSTMESISAGIPMLCRPCFGDQMMNARYVCDVWKVGITLENGLERGEISRGITSLLMGEGVEMRDRASELKEKASCCMQRGGSSTKSLDKLVEHLLA